MFCVYCGADNEEGAKFCAQCGREMKSPLQEVRMENTPQVSKKNTNSKKVFLIIGGIVIAAVVAIAAILISGSIKEKEYQAKVEKGFKYLEEQEYEKAEAEFLAAIEIEAKDIKVYKGLVEAYEQMERDDDVADVYETIVTLVDEEYEKSKDLSSENEEVYLSAIECFKANDNREKVLMLLDNLQSMTESEELSAQLDRDEELWGRYGGYLELLYEYAEKYGMNDVIYSEEMMGYLEGLAFAKLLDFDGNGTEELMVAYSFKEEGIDKALIEVWDYADGELIKVFEEEPFTEIVSDNTIATIYMNKIDERYHIITGYTGNQVNTVYKVWARNGEQFELNSMQEMIRDGGNYYYRVDGKETNSEIWNERGTRKILSSSRIGVEYILMKM